MVGEDHFSLLLQQGAKRHIHISLVSDNFMLGCIFEDVSKIGLLRTYTRRLSPRIGELSQVTWVQPSPSAKLDGATGKATEETAQFREYALDLIDRIFAS